MFWGALRSGGVVETIEFYFFVVPSLKIFFIMFSGCPEAIKVLVGNKCDLTPEVDLSQAKVSSSARSRPCPSWFVVSMCEAEL